MSNPVSNHDIEDVLSSIRRLVAQGQHGVKQEPALRTVEPAVSDRLVLTPAFRVPDAVEDVAAVPTPKMPTLKMPPQFEPPIPAAPVEETFWTSSVDDDFEDETDLIGEQTVLESTIAELEAAVARSSDEWGPDGNEGSVESSVTSAFLHKLDAQRPATTEDTVTQAVTDHISAAITEEIEENLSFEDVHFPKVDLPSDVTEDALPEENLPEDKLAEDDLPEDELAEDVDAAQPEIADAENIKVVDIDVVAPANEDDTFSHAKVETVYDPVAEATAAQAEAEGGDIYGDELAPDVEPTFGTVATPSDVQLVDPDALRALVGEMIRSELQGEMGERITRNVRSLVRREINRVLTEQDV